MLFFIFVSFMRTTLCSLKAHRSRFANEVKYVSFPSVIIRKTLLWIHDRFEHYEYA